MNWNALTQKCEDVKYDKKTGRYYSDIPEDNPSCEWADPRILKQAPKEKDKWGANLESLELPDKTTSVDPYVTLALNDRWSAKLWDSNMMALGGQYYSTTDPSRPITVSAPSKFGHPNKTGQNSMCVCPLYQDNKANPTDCKNVGLPPPNRAKVPHDKFGGCKSEEYYPGCGSISGFGQKVETLVLEGTYTNMFTWGGQQEITKNTCDVLCPGLKIDCDTPTLDSEAYDAMKGTGVLNETYTCKCDEYDYKAYLQCQGRNSKKCTYSNETTGAYFQPTLLPIDKYLNDYDCVPRKGIRRPEKCNEWMSSICPEIDGQMVPGGSLVNGQPCIFPPYKDPLNEVWRNMYSTPIKELYDNFDECGIDQPIRSTPVRFDVTSVKVTPHTATQVAYLEKKCPTNKKWTIGKTIDIADSNCDYLHVKGLFSQKPVPDCPTGHKCLFVSVYKHTDNFLYVSKPQKTFAAMMRSPIYADGVYALDGVSNCVSPAPTTSMPSMLVPALTLLALALPFLR